MGVILLAVMAVVIFMVWKQHSGGFATGFATLLENPVAGGGGLGTYFTGREHVGGEFGARPVVLSIQQKRSRYGLGYLIVAMQAKGAVATASGGSAFIWDLVRDPEGREALSRLEKRHGLELAFEDGWFKATWKPVGLFVFFPGRFVEEDWRMVLKNMRQAMTSIEGASATG